jgi:galactokinase
LSEHIDYNDGFVLPAAIDKIFVLLSKKQFHTRKLLDLNDEFEVDLTTEMELTNVWTNYIRGVINQ